MDGGVQKRGAASSRNHRQQRPVAAGAMGSEVQERATGGEGLPLGAVTQGTLGTVARRTASMEAPSAPVCQSHVHKGSMERGGSWPTVAPTVGQRP